MNHLNTINKILILAPHTDDGELGCGGFINKLLESDKEVYYIAFSKCEASVPPGYPRDILAKELFKALLVLGMREEQISLYNYPVREFPSFRQKILEILVKVNQSFQ